MTQLDADAADAAPRISALSPFRYPLFRSVWAASTLSNLGALIQSVGAAWMMIQIARSADMVAFAMLELAVDKKFS